MASFANTRFNTILLFALAGFLIIAGCASVQTPGGGPKDTQPPKVLKESPKNLTKNFNSKIIEIEFDEFIKLNAEYKEVSMSPATNRQPQFKVKRNILEIKLLDTLEKNTTYTINFGKAVLDYNAGNILKNYTYVFSTGDIIDSLYIAGKVVQTLTKKPEPDIPVFVIPTRQDSIFGKHPARIFTTTDSAGAFVLKNLKPDTYRLYALKEQGGDRIYNSVNEEIAFLPNPISVTQNIYGLVLETFKELPRLFITEDRKIEPEGRIFFKFNQPLTNPALKILAPEELDSKKTVEFSAKGDTALLWLPELTFDSLKVAIQTKGSYVDTVILRRARRDTYTRAIAIKDNASTGINNITPLTFTFSSPVSDFDTGKIELIEDTTHVKIFRLIKDPASLRKYQLLYPWKSGHTYTFVLADNAFTGPFGATKIYKNTFRIGNTDIYGNFTLDIKVPRPANYIVQVIKDEKDIIRANTVSNSTKLEYHNIPTGRYLIRVIYDANQNGEWDTGNVKQNIQPEQVWNYPQIFTLRSNLELNFTLEIP